MRKVTYTYRRRTSSIAPPAAGHPALAALTVAVLGAASILAGAPASAEGEPAAAASSAGRVAAETGAAAGDTFTVQAGTRRSPPTSRTTPWPRIGGPPDRTAPTSRNG